MAEYTIDELARAAGTNVRNVRAYQDRRILPPPNRRGRVGVYTDLHLARLRTIGQLLERGYTLNNIAELLEGLVKGQDIAEVLGLERAISSPWSSEIATSVTPKQLSEMLGNVFDADLLHQAIKVGLFEQDGDRLRVPSPRALEVGMELVRAGVPIFALLQQYAMLREDTDRIAQRLINLFVGEFVDKFGDALPPASELPRLADLIQRLRPHVRSLVDAEMARSLERVIGTALGDRMARALRQRADEASKRKKVGGNAVAKTLRRVTAPKKRR